MKLDKRQWLRSTFWMLAILLWTSTAHNKGANKIECSKRELDQQNCALEKDGYRVNLTKESLVLNDGVWRAVEEFPLRESNMEWASAKWLGVPKRRIIELRLWGAVADQTKIQDEHWYLIELGGPKAQVLVHEILRKRKVAEVAAGGQQNYLVDQDAKPQVSREPAGHWVWKVGNKKGRL